MHYPIAGTTGLTTCYKIPVSKSLRKQHNILETVLGLGDGNGKIIEKRNAAAFVIGYYLLLHTLFFSSRNQKSFGEYQVIESPGIVSLPPRIVPPTILHPPYSKDTFPCQGPQVPEVKTGAQIESMRESCALARKTLNYAKETIQVLFKFY